MFLISLFLWSAALCPSAAFGALSLQLTGKGGTCFESEHYVLLVLNAAGKLKHINPTNINRIMNSHI